MAGLAYGVDVRDELRAHMKYIVPGDLALAIEKAYPFGEALDALAKVETRRARQGRTSTRPKR